MGQALPNLLGDEGHKRVQQLEGICHDIHQNLLGIYGSLSACLQAALHQLDVPVAEDIPDEIV